MKRLAALLLLASAARAQVARTEAQSVLVDVLVTDKKGNYVPDLTAKDFQVFEDGKEQTVDGIFTEKGAAAGPKHSVLLLFDNAAMTVREQSAARLLAMDLVEKVSSENPNIAVLDFGGSLRITQTFTSDVTRAKQAIAQPKGGPLSAGDPSATTISASNDFALRDLLKSLDGLVKNLQGAAGRKTLIFFTPGYLMTSEFSSRLDLLVGAANRSNVSIYPVNTRTATSFGGTLMDVSAPPPVAPQRGRGGSATLTGTPTGMNAGDPAPGSGVPNGPALLSILLKMAEGTGGFVVRQPGDEAALSRISKEQGEFYILSYTPPDSPDGSCHKLRVKVKRDGLNLRSREGYCKRTPGALLSGNAAERTLEQRALAQANGNIPATIQAPYFYKAPNVARVAAVMELNPANVTFKKEKNKFVAQFDILGIANKEDGAAGARFSDIVKLEFDTQAQVDQFKRTPYRYENQFDIAPGEYKLAVAVGGGGESFARLLTPLSIEPYAGNEFSLSGIALSRQFRSASDVASGLDEFLIDDRKKLIADGAEIVPSGSPKLAAAGPAGMFIEIYEPLLARPEGDNPLVVAFQLRVLARESNEIKADTGMMRVDLRGKQGTASIPLGLNLPVTSLVPGAYLLEFQALDSAGKSAKRTTPFEIE